jgi:UPF0271 protein
MRAIDLNADMGEYADEAQRAVEAALTPLISSCSIACGGHAGDEKTMRETARRAKAYGVSVGAHPSYPDRKGFGRRSRTIAADELAESLRAQIAALKSILDAEGVTLAHVKPHGALYNDAARDIALARIVAQVACDAILVGPPQSMLERAAKELNAEFAVEGFVDRLYLKSGALAPRSQPGGVIEDIAARTHQALAIARGEPVAAADGELTLAVKTLCIHSDSPGAVETARAVRAGLEADGFAIRTFA